MALACVSWICVYHSMVQRKLYRRFTWLARGVRSGALALLGAVAAEGRGDSILPVDFWALTPAEGMLAFLEASRNAEHREKYYLVYSCAEDDAPSPLSRLSLDDSPSQCYSSGSRHLFFRSRLGDSYYVSGRVRTPGGARLFNAVYSPTTYELSFVPLEDSVARDLAERISSLSQIEVERRKDFPGGGTISFSSTWSSADGHGYLRLWKGASSLEPKVWSGSLWARGADLKKRFNYKLREEARLNFANILLAHEFPMHVGIPVDPDAAVGETAVLEILKRYSSEETEISTALVQIAAEVAGDRALAAARQALESILSQTPQSAAGTGALLKKENQLQLDIWDLAPKLRAYGVLYGDSTSDVPEAQRLMDLRDRLQESRKAISVSEAERERFAFRQSLEVALRKIAAADDSTTLKQWVESEGYGARWALRRLHDAFPEVYVDALEAFLRDPDHPQRGELLNFIHAVDEGYGAQLAGELIEDTPDDELFVACFRILQRRDSVPNEAAHLRRLLKLIHADFTDQYLRARAIGLLVPDKEPLRYEDPAIEAALNYVLSPNNSIRSKSYVPKSASRALARRDAARAP